MPFTFDACLHSLYYKDINKRPLPYLRQEQIKVWKRKYSPVDNNELKTLNIGQGPKV